MSKCIVLMIVSLGFFATLQLLQLLQPYHQPLLRFPQDARNAAGDRRGDLVGWRADAAPARGTGVRPKFVLLSPDDPD